MRYCLDTSSILEAWVRTYPPTTFPGLWEQFDELIENGRFWSSEEVLRELEDRDDDVYAWAKDREQAFLVIDDEIQTNVTNILASHPRLMGQRANRNHADPFVIATAQAKGLCVVTEEDLGSLTKPRIPYVCNDYGIRCISVLDLIKTEGWVF